MFVREIVVQTTHLVISVLFSSVLHVTRCMLQFFTIFTYALLFTMREITHTY